MKRTLFSLATLLLTLGGVASAQAQNNNSKAMVVHLKGQSPVNILISDVDSVTFAPLDAVQGDVQLTFDEISKCYVRPHFTPKDNSQYYYANYMTEEEFAAYASLDDVAKDDSIWLAEMAAGYEMDVEEIVHYFCYQGEFEEVQAELLPGHNYVYWVHAVNSKGGPVGKVSMCRFTTTDYQLQPGTVTLDVESTDKGFKVTSTPDDNNRYYTTGVISENAIEEGASLRDFVQQSISNQLYDYLLAEGLGYYLQSNASKGVQTTSYEGLDAVGYYVIAAYLDADAAISSELVYKYVPSSSATKPSTKTARQSGRQAVKRHTLPAQNAAIKTLKP